MFNVDYAALESGLELMGTGMLGIFIVLFLLYLMSILLIKFFPNKSKRNPTQKQNQKS